MFRWKLIVIFDDEGKSSVGNLIQHMWDQEKEHKKTFDELLPKYRARPTAMLPLWNVAGFMLGAGKWTDQLSCLNQTNLCQVIE